MTDEQQIAALREEIRQAAVHLDGTLDRFFRVVVGIAIVAFTAGAVTTLVALHGWLRPVAWLAATAFGILAAFGTVILFSGGAFFVPLAAASRRALYLSRFRRRLASLPDERRIAVLVPLRGDRTAGHLVAPLLRGISIPAEISPAPATDARGDEASPAEKMP